MSVVLIVLVAIIVVVVLWGISAYNKMVAGRNLVEQSWNQIDVELNRRYDLIPNLVNTIKGATNYEQSTLEAVVGLRNQAAALAGAKADPSQRAQVEDQLGAQLRNLVSLTVEAYPDLKANAGFVQLQNELSEIESRIANARKYYNANVGNYNTAIESFPNSLLAGIGHFTKATYFQIQDPGVRQNPVVDFGGGAPALPSQTSQPFAAPPTQMPNQMPTQMSAPFAPPPGPPGDYSQPNFGQSSGVPDRP